MIQHAQAEEGIAPTKSMSGIVRAISEDEARLEIAPRSTTCTMMNVKKLDGEILYAYTPALSTPRSTEMLSDERASRCQGFGVVEKIQVDGPAYVTVFDM